MSANLDQTHITPRLYSLSGFGFDADIIASAHTVSVALTGKTFDVAGWPRASSALANLSIIDARRLSRLLAEAACAAEGVDERQIEMPPHALAPANRDGWRTE